MWHTTYQSRPLRVCTYLDTLTNIATSEHDLLPARYVSRRFWRKKSVVAIIKPLHEEICLSDGPSVTEIGCDQSQIICDFFFQITPLSRTPPHTPTFTEQALYSKISRPNTSLGWSSTSRATSLGSGKQRSVSAARLSGVTTLILPVLKSVIDRPSSSAHGAILSCGGGMIEPSSPITWSGVISVNCTC